MKVLIVEDEVNAREGLAYLLSKISSEYVVCGKALDGEQGVTLALEQKPDLIFVDIEMPKLDGLQMIEKIKAAGEEPSFIILSGYSDFKYAQKGIRLGITDYLLKPIAYNDLVNVMEKRLNEYKLKEEKANQIVQKINEEEILSKIMLNEDNTSIDAYELLKQVLKNKGNMYVFNLYLPKGYVDRYTNIVTQIIGFMNHYDIRNYYYSFIKEYNYLTVFIESDASYTEIIKMLKYNLLFSLKNKEFSDVYISVLKLQDLSEINNCLSRLQSLSKWPISIGNDDILNEGLIKELKVSTCVFPRELEKEMMMAVKNNDYVRVHKINEKFMLHIKAHIYNPYEIIDICCNYAFSIFTFLKGCNDFVYNELRVEEILDQLRACCTMKELREEFDNLLHKLCKASNEENANFSLPVRKTVNYIKEYYHDKISLEEIAESMGITPEYLSRLFTKEIGKSFSDYLKELRIDKAKKLLASEKVKIYEVAEAVGYNDPKYFCKIFKEGTGMSPKEYTKFY